jgi:hypothetical protein
MATSSSITLAQLKSSFRDITVESFHEKQKKTIPQFSIVCSNWKWRKMEDGRKSTDVLKARILQPTSVDKLLSGDVISRPQRAPKPTKHHSKYIAIGKALQCRPRVQRNQH